MAQRTKAAEPRDEQKWGESEQVVQDLQRIIQSQNDPRLQPVKVWVNRVNAERGMLYLGIALGEALGCSPFCGCAAKQIGDQFEPFLIERLPWLTRVIVEPEAPTESDPGHVLLKFI
ncbi:MAG: hypothetical protein HYY02_03470 [Chloroflexi bacterium]|nr:hypothetical protein [Chloroflexota bacterium]